MGEGCMLNCDCEGFGSWPSMKECWAAWRVWLIGTSSSSSSSSVRTGPRPLITLPSSIAAFASLLLLSFLFCSSVNLFNALDSISKLMLLRCAFFNALFRPKPLAPPLYSLDFCFSILRDKIPEPAESFTSTLTSLPSLGVRGIIPLDDPPAELAGLSRLWERSSNGLLG